MDCKEIKQLKELMALREDGKYVSSLRIDKAIDKLSKRIADLEEQTKTIFIEGNNGGNFVRITRKDDKRIHLEVGDCTLWIFDCIVPNEWLSRILTSFTFSLEGSVKYKSKPKELLHRHGWGGSHDINGYQEKLMKMIEDVMAPEPTDENEILRAELDKKWKEGVRYVCCK